MAEIALPLLALGSLYIYSNKDKELSEAGQLELKQVQERAIKIALGSTSATVGLTGLILSGYFISDFYTNYNLFTAEKKKYDNLEEGNNFSASRKKILDYQTKQQTDFIGSLVTGGAGLVFAVTSVPLFATILPGKQEAKKSAFNFTIKSGFKEVSCEITLLF